MKTLQHTTKFFESDRLDHMQRPVYKVRILEADGVSYIDVELYGAKIPQMSIAAFGALLEFLTEVDATL